MNGRSGEGDLRHHGVDHERRAVIDVLGTHTTVTVNSGCWSIPRFTRSVAIAMRVRQQRSTHRAERLMTVTHVPRTREWDETRRLTRPRRREAPRDHYGSLRRQ